MPTTLAFKPLIDLPEWRPIANAPNVSAAGTQLLAGLRNNGDRGAYVYLLVNNTTLWAYDVEDDDWFQLGSPALAGTFGAGAGAVMMPSQGPRGTLATGNTTSSIVLSTALPAAAGPNQLANWRTRGTVTALRSASSATALEVRAKRRRGLLLAIRVARRRLSTSTRRSHSRRRPATAMRSCQAACT